MRYDCTKYRSPWGAFKETLESRAVRESWERRGPKREIIRMALNQERVDAAPAKREQKRQATAAPPQENGEAEDGTSSQTKSDDETFLARVKWQR